ncbi:MAG: ATP-binding protein, partial [Limnobacter sp.]|nr:ATP-binding protein [Limnobacter sp.]
SPPLTPLAVFFTGPPGTGKTWISHQIAEKILDALLVTMSVTEFCNTRVRKIPPTILATGTPRIWK